MNTITIKAGLYNTRISIMEDTGVVRVQAGVFDDEGTAIPIETFPTVSDVGWYQDLSGYWQLKRMPTSSEAMAKILVRHQSEELKKSFFCFLPVSEQDLVYNIKLSEKKPHPRMRASYPLGEPDQGYYVDTFSNETLEEARETILGAGAGKTLLIRNATGWSVLAHGSVMLRRVCIEYIEKPSKAISRYGIKDIYEIAPKGQYSKGMIEKKYWDSVSKSFITPSDGRPLNRLFSLTMNDTYGVCSLVIPGDSQTGRLSALCSAHVPGQHNANGVQFTESGDVLPFHYVRPM